VAERRVSGRRRESRRKRGRGRVRETVAYVKSIVRGAMGFGNTAVVQMRG